MAREPEIRLSQGTAIVVIALVGLAIFGWNAGWFKGTAATPTAAVVAPGATPTPPATPVVIPAIEKTKVYLSTIDQADFEGENQKNRVVGTVDLIKSGNVLETVTTSASSGVASAAEFNGGDVVTALGDAAGFYAHAILDVKVAETLQPFEVFIKDADLATVTVLDDKKDELTGPYAMTLAMNDVSKTHYIHLERPGDDTWYQFCGVGIDFDDDAVDVRLKDASGSFVQGTTSLLGPYDDLKTNEGVDQVWAFNQPLKNFDELDIAFVVATAKDILPVASVINMVVFDCEENLQNGKIVYSSEDGADADVGEAHIPVAITVN